MDHMVMVSDIPPSPYTLWLLLYMGVEVQTTECRRSLRCAIWVSISSISRASRSAIFWPSEPAAHSKLLSFTVWLWGCVYARNSWRYYFHVSHHTLIGTVTRVVLIGSLCKLLNSCWRFLDSCGEKKQFHDSLQVNWGVLHMSKSWVYFLVL